MRNPYKGEYGLCNGLVCIQKMLPVVDLCCICLKFCMMGSYGDQQTTQDVAKTEVCSLKTDCLPKAQSNRPIAHFTWRASLGPSMILLYSSLFGERRYHGGYCKIIPDPNPMINRSTSHHSCLGYTLRQWRYRICGSRQPMYSLKGLPGHERESMSYTV